MTSFREDPDEPYEVVDALPVLATAEPSAMDHARPEPAALSAVPKRQVLALAAGSFVAGAATIALVGTRKGAKVTPRRGPAKPSLWDVVASDSYRVDVHRLRGS